MLTLAKPRPTPETLIADRGGATPGYANDPARLLDCNKWIDYAKPIILAMLALDDEADSPLVSAVTSGDKVIAADCRVARSVIRGAYNELRDQLIDIRHEIVADSHAGAQDDDAAQEEADDFNDWLDDNAIGVDDAINIVSDEKWEARHA